MNSENRPICVPGDVLKRIDMDVWVSVTQVVFDGAEWMYYIGANNRYGTDELSLVELYEPQPAIAVKREWPKDEPK